MLNYCDIWYASLCKKRLIKMTTNITDISSPDSHAISLKIIEAIKQHPVLYISEVKGNAIKLQEFRQKVWKRISDELGLDPVWVKLKWKNLRDTYCRILKYKNKSPKGLRRKKWMFEDQLSFLKFPYEPNYEPQSIELTEDYINDINTEVISPQDLLEQLDDNEEDEDYSEYLEVLEEDSSFEETPDQEFYKAERVEGDRISQHLQQKAIDEYAKQIQSKFRKIRPKCIKLEDNVKTITPIIIKTQPTIIPLQKALNTQSIPVVKRVKQLPITHNNFDYKGSTDEFFSYVAQTVKKLPPKAQADIKMDICKLISEAEICHSEHLTPNLKRHTGAPGMIPKMVLVPCKLIDKNYQKAVD